MVIGPNQSAFIVGRQILDGCLIANEIIIKASIEKTKLLLFKVDFEKAFDSVNWSFLQNIMRQMGFGIKWRTWIASCISSTSILILVNRSPSKEFKMERGLSCGKGLYKGVYLRNNGANLSLLQYADDALFFGDWSRLNVMHLIHILKFFELASGLKVNIAKSRLMGVGVSISEVENLASSLGCAFDSMPFIYLGLPVGKKMRNIDGWDVVKNRFRERLSSWKAKGGRLTLVKSVLDGSFGALKTLTEAFVGLSRKPFSPMLRMEAWGLEVFEPKILVFFVNGNGDYISRRRRFGLRVICEFYGNDGGLSSNLSSCGAGGVWCDVLKSIKQVETIDTNFKDSFTIKVGCGINTSFWKDSWFSPGLRLMDIFTRLFALDTDKDCSVCLDDISSLNSLLGNFKLKPCELDKWSWDGDASGKFRVCSLSKKIDDIMLHDSTIGEHHIWNSWIPRKVNVCTWRASIDRLPTRSNPVNRGVALPSVQCCLCNREIEAVEHCIIRCSRVVPIWRNIWSWWGIPSPSVFPSFSNQDIVKGNVKTSGCHLTNKVLNGVLLCSIWSIWKRRNKVSHADLDLAPKIIEEDLFPAIQRITKTWMSARLKSPEANWNNWISRPFDIFP
ncbi:putative RNA-directed DNA polymerase [Tanacetum coccineum]